MCISCSLLPGRWYRSDRNVHSITTNGTVIHSKVFFMWTFFAFFSSSLQRFVCVSSCFYMDFVDIFMIVLDCCDSFFPLSISGVLFITSFQITECVIFAFALEWSNLIHCVFYMLLYVPAHFVFRIQTFAGSPPFSSVFFSTLIFIIQREENWHQCFRFYCWILPKLSGKVWNHFKNKGFFPFLFFLQMTAIIRGEERIVIYKLMEKLNWKVEWDNRLH